MQIDTQKAKVYRNIYRPSFGLFSLVKTLFAVLLAGHSPLGHSRYYGSRKRGQ